MFPLNEKDRLLIPPLIWIFGNIFFNVFVALQLENGANGTVELSRTRNIGSSAIIIGSKGQLIFDLLTGDIETKPSDLLKIEINGLIGKKIKTESYIDLFVQQYSAWYNAIRLGSGEYIKGGDVLPSIKIMSQCYKIKKELSYNWIEKWN